MSDWVILTLATLAMAIMCVGLIYLGRRQQRARTLEEERDDIASVADQRGRPMPTRDDHVRSAERRLHELRRTAARKNRMR